MRTIQLEDQVEGNQVLQDVRHLEEIEVEAAYSMEPLLVRTGCQRHGTTAAPQPRLLAHRPQTVAVRFRLVLRRSASWSKRLKVGSSPVLDISHELQVGVHITASSVCGSLSINWLIS